MKKATQITLTLLLILAPTLQMSAMENEHDKFKADLLQEIKEEIKDMPKSEIRRIINEVDKQVTEYMDHYEKTSKEKLLTKEELYLTQHSDEVSAKTFSASGIQSGKSKEQLALEALNPKLQMLSDDDYHYNEETKELEFSITKDKMFHIQEDSMVQATLWQLVDRGDVLVNLTNGKTSSLLGHAGLMKDKGNHPSTSFTIEALGYGYNSQVVSYGRWHYNDDDQITYNYVPAVYKTNKSKNAVSYAERHLIGRPYGLMHALGTAREIYCTELVFLAYKSQGVHLGHRMDVGSWGILFPKDLYCDADLAPYYKQNVGGGIC